MRRSLSIHHYSVQWPKYGQCQKKMAGQHKKKQWHWPTVANARSFVSRATVHFKSNWCVLFFAHHQAIDAYKNMRTIHAPRAMSTTMLSYKYVSTSYGPHTSVHNINNVRVVDVYQDLSPAQNKRRTASWSHDDTKSETSWGLQPKWRRRV